MNVESDPAQQREQRLMLLEDHTGRALSESHANGEFRSASSSGKPLKLGDGFDETPDELRMGMKILKNAGVLPPKVELMRDIEALRLTLVDAPDTEATRAGQQRLNGMRQALALRLESPRFSASH